MDDDRVLVPPEVHDELEALQQSGDLHPDDRQQAQRVASEQGYDHAVDWLEQVGDKVYARAARDGFTAQTED